MHCKRLYPTRDKTNWRDHETDQRKNNKKIDRMQSSLSINHKTDTTKCAYHVCVSGLFKKYSHSSFRHALSLSLIGEKVFRNEECVKFLKSLSVYCSHQGLNRRREDFIATGTNLYIRFNEGEGVASISWKKRSSTEGPATAGATTQPLNAQQ